MSLTNVFDQRQRRPWVADLDRSALTRKPRSTGLALHLPTREDLSPCASFGDRDANGREARFPGTNTVFHSWLPSYDGHLRRPPSAFVPCLSSCRKSVSRFAAAVNGVGEGVLVVDREGRMFPNVNLRARERVFDGSGEMAKLFGRVFRCQGRSKFGPLRRSKSRPVGEGVAVFVGRLERSLRSPFRAAQA